MSSPQGGRWKGQGSAKRAEEGERRRRQQQLNSASTLGAGGKRKRRKSLPNAGGGGLGRSDGGKNLDSYVEKEEGVVRRAPDRGKHELLGDRALNKKKKKGKERTTMKNRRGDPSILSGG